MSASPPFDRSGRAPLVPPGPSAPPVPTRGAAPAERFTFLPDEPMKRPPLDQAARVFTTTERERTHEALLAREDVLRQPAPSALERAVNDMKEGTAIGASIIAHAASSYALRIRVRAAAATRAVARAARFTWEALGAGGRLGWHVTTRIATGAMLVLLAVGLAIAALLVGLASALKTGVVLLAHAVAAGWRHLRRVTPAASAARAAVSAHAGAAETIFARVRDASSHAATRASSWSQAVLTGSARDISHLRLTIRWHARTARPIIGAVAVGFTRQLVHIVRHTEPRLLIGGLGVAAAVVIAAVYGVPRRDAASSRAVAVPPVSAPRQPALASVADAAQTAALIESLTLGSAALLGAPADPQGASGAAAVTAAPAAKAGQETRSPAESMVGTLQIASAPVGARVTIDGIPRGIAPLSVSRLRAGNRIVRLELNGYQRWSWAVYVSASRRTRLHVSLVPDSAPSPSPAVTNTAAAK